MTAIAWFGNRQQSVFKLNTVMNVDFDLSPSDLKHVKEPLWMDKTRGAPTLVLYSIVDDRSGVAYEEYHCVYGEDVEFGDKRYGPYHPVGEPIPLGCYRSYKKTKQQKRSEKIHTLAMEEIGSRTTILTHEGIQGHKTEHINWLFEKCLKKDVKRTDIIADDASRNWQLLDTKPVEIRSFLHGALTPARTQELQNNLLAIGIPL